MDSFEVENFRSLKHLKLEKLARVNLLVGKNNSGKTSVLEAVWTFFASRGSQWLPSIEAERGMDAEKIDFLYLFHNFNSGDEINLKVTYKGITEKDSEMQLLNVNLKLLDKIAQQETGQRYQDRRGIPLHEISSSALLISLEGFLPSKILTFNLFRIDNGEMWLTPGSDEAKDFLNNGNPYPRSRAIEFVATKIDRSLLGRKIERIKINKGEAILLAIMRAIDPRIQKIELLTAGQIYLDLGEKFTRLLPLTAMGEGIQRLLDIISAFSNVAGAVILIDEIDNGLHYSALRILWKGILQAAREYDVQVFATTHSAEALRHLTWVLDDDEYKDYRNDVAAYTLIRAKDDTVRSFRYDYEQLDFAMEHDMEVRN